MDRERLYSPKEEFTLEQNITVQLEEHAVTESPNECCGFILEKHGTKEVVRIENQQNQRHVMEPTIFTRTGKTAYFMNPLQVGKVNDKVEEEDSKILAIYHSHPDHEISYFSKTDKKDSLVNGQPLYPDAIQIVISVKDKVIKDKKAFKWDSSLQDFTEVKLLIST